MKYLAVLSLAILAVYITSSIAQSHNVTWGDQLLARATIAKKYKLLQVISEDYKFPVKGVNYRNISLIRVVDEYTNGNGGYANLTSGGPGYRNATIHVKSQRNHGYNFTIEIYGR